MLILGSKSAFAAAPITPFDMAPTQDGWLERLNATTEATGYGERRRSLRMPLHWTLYLASRSGTHPRRTETKNLSRDGFYCLLDQPLTAGEHVDCDIVIPTHEPDCRAVVSLRCRAQVIRVEKIDSGEQYGLACRIEDYHLIHSAREEALRASARQMRHV